MSKLKLYPSLTEYLIRFKASSESEKAGTKTGMLFFAATEIGKMKT